MWKEAKINGLIFLFFSTQATFAATQGDSNKQYSNLMPSAKVFEKTFSHCKLSDANQKLSDAIQMVNLKKPRVNTHAHSRDKKFFTWRYHTYFPGGNRCRANFSFTHG
jgi:hypothetical protein